MNSEDELRRISVNDQAITAMRDMAYNVAEFFNALKEKQVSEIAAIQFTLIWMQYILSRAQNG